MGKRTRHLTGKVHKMRPRDYWPTIDPRCVPPLLRHVEPGARYAEPMAGGGHLKILLDGHRRPWRDDPAAPRCVWAGDLHPGAPGIHAFDAMTDTVPDGDMVITNPPWTRALLHPLIVRLSDQKPTWLLFDSDWAHTAQCAEFSPRLRKVVQAGRLIWVHGTDNAGFTACAWYLFDRPRVGNVPMLYPVGVGPDESHRRAPRVCPDCGVLIDRFAKWRLQSRNGVPTPVHRDCRNPSGWREPVPTPLFDCLEGE